MYINSEKIQELVDKWYMAGEVVGDHLPDIQDLRPVDQLGVLAKAQSICAQELSTVVENNAKDEA